jgi:glycosyltransferase involved in cell wall biosynthesis
VGVDAPIAPWLEKSDPRRTLVFAQSAPPSRWLEMLRALAADGAQPLELVVDSRAKAGRFGGGHHVLPIPLDVTAFAAKPHSRSHDSAEFVVGNVAQNGREIRSAPVGSLQEHVATAGIRLDVYDPGRFRNALGAMRNVRCFSRRDSSLAQFLAPLSCYLYYCDTWWEEGLGRDLFGAMALGIPVLCPRASVHAESIEDGVFGFLYDDDAGALEALATLRNDPARRTAMGAAARESARRIFEAQAIALAYRRLVAGA